MERKEVVADASVIVKWFVKEEYSREARLLREAYAAGTIDIAVPSILPFEVLNALKYSGGFGEEELKEVSTVLDDFQFTHYGLTGELAQNAVEIAMRKGVTIYDASYLALAKLLKTAVYTAGTKLVRKINNPNLIRHIMELKI